MNLPFFIARRYLAGNKGAFSTFIIRLAVIATALSVAVMIVAVAVLVGFNHAITEKLYGFMGHVHVVPYDETNSNSLSYTQPIYKDSQLTGRIRAMPYVTQVVPFVERPVIVQAHGNMEGIVLKGVGPDYRFLSGVEVLGGNIDYSDSSYAHQVMLSKTTAERLNAGIGDTLQLDFIEASGLPRIRRVRVCGLYHSGLEDVDKFFALCDIRLLQRMNNWSADSINGFQIDLSGAAYADTTASYIHYNLLKAPLEAYTTADNFSAIFDWLRVQGTYVMILLVIITVVSVINMATVLLILMINRARMIGLLKALGMPFHQSRNIFLGIAALIAGMGILLGNILGLGLCWLQLHYKFITLREDAYFMKYAPIRVIWWQVAAIDVATLVVCIFCMWLPALYIRRVQPVRVLQFR